MIVSSPIRVLFSIDKTDDLTAKHNVRDTCAAHEKRDNLLLRRSRVTVCKRERKKEKKRGLKIVTNLFFSFCHFTTRYRGRKLTIEPCCVKLYFRLTASLFFLYFFLSLFFSSYFSLFLYGLPEFAKFDAYYYSYAAQRTSIDGVDVFRSLARASA